MPTALSSNASLIQGGWRQGLFAPIAPTAAALLRITLAVVLIVIFWNNPGPLTHSLSQIPIVERFYANGVLTPAYGWLTVGLSIALAVGWRPRLIGPILLILLLPLACGSSQRQSRQVLLFTLLAFSFVRSDAKWSIHWDITAQPAFSAGPIWPLRLIQLQLSVLYGVNALAKTTTEYLSGQTLVAMSQVLPNFLIDLSDGNWHLGPLAIPAALLAVASVITEYVLAIGFWWRRFRFFVAAIGIVFHISLTWITTIHMLDWAAMFLYLAFLLPMASPTDLMRDGRVDNGARYDETASGEKSQPEDAVQSHGHRAWP